ncbi:MAG: 23S rRNA (guanosine(2251)-2'-O)-methyltransferase RlmB [Anaerolineae bacterium]|nr:23S rRNA (guanosine(2251)-2'-O)-methyltransferase RlmB [Anaerolineae bacterium]
MREWIYGRNPVYEVLRAGRRDAFQLLVAEGAQDKGRLGEILRLAAKKKLIVIRVPRQKLDRINTGNQGVALEAAGYPYSSLDEMLVLAEERQQKPFILILDALQDPQNLGTLLRTAEAVGVHGIMLPLRQAAMVSPAVVAASSGASEHMLVTQANLAQAITILKDENIWVVGLDGGPDSQSPDQVRLDGSVALVVGNEGQGMRRLVRESCDLLLRLPMRGNVESLNAAVAGSVALYFAWGARGFK